MQFLCGLDSLEVTVSVGLVEIPHKTCSVCSSRSQHRVQRFLFGHDVLIPPGFCSGGGVSCRY